MNKALLLSFIFLAVISSAFALTGNTTNYTINGDIVQASEKGNTSAHTVYYVITEQPVQIRGSNNGTLSYVGFFPLHDNITYFVPFSNGLFVFHCNPDNVELDDSIICTGNLLDANGTAINNAHIDWQLHSSNGTQYAMGDFIFIGNGAYKFSIPITIAQNFTTGDYYFKFISTGFGTDYLFPVHLSITYLQENLLVLFVMLMIIISIITVIFGYWRKAMNFVVFGAFAMILIGMVMLDERTLFGDKVSLAFGVIFALTGLVFLLVMFIERWTERVRKKREDNQII
jgi:hypothetical protein